MLTVRQTPVTPLSNKGMTMRAEAHLHITRALSGMVDCISYRPLPGGKTKHVSALHLGCVTFAVQPAGLARFRKTGQKNVHAYVRGEVQSVTYNRWPHNIDPDWREVKYNPKVNDTFVDAQTGQPVKVAGEAILIGRKVWYR